MPVSRLIRPWLLAVILFSTVGCDQLTKTVARASFTGSQPVSFCGGIVQFTLALNPGGFLRLGHSLTPSFRTVLFTVGVSIGLLLGAAYLLFRPLPSRAIWLGSALIISGGFSNLIDRVFCTGLVTDFCVVTIGPFHTGVFNVADLAVTIGTVLIILSARAISSAPA